MNRRFVFSPGEYYHVFSRGVEKRNIFRSSKDYERFLLLLFLSNSNRRFHLSDYQGKKAIDVFDTERGKTLSAIGVYSLMPNHFHLLMKEKKEGGISSFMQKLCTAYSMYFNIKYERSGTLLSRPFRAVHIRKDRHLKYLFAYIHLNPLELMDVTWKDHVRSVTKKGEQFLTNYNYSSYLDYTDVRRPHKAILEPQEFPKYFQSMLDFKEFVDDWIDMQPHVKVTP